MGGLALQGFATDYAVEMVQKDPDESDDDFGLALKCRVLGDQRHLAATLARCDVHIPSSFGPPYGKPPIRSYGQGL